MKLTPRDFPISPGASSRTPKRTREKKGLRQKGHLRRCGGTRPSPCKYLPSRRTADTIVRWIKKHTEGREGFARVVEGLTVFRLGRTLPSRFAMRYIYIWIALEHRATWTLEFQRASGSGPCVYTRDRPLPFWPLNLILCNSWDKKIDYCVLSNLSSILSHHFSSNADLF